MIASNDATTMTHVEIPAAYVPGVTVFFWKEQQFYLDSVLRESKT